MKKLLIAVVAIISSLLMLWLGFIWYAMAEASATIIYTNAEFWRQQLYITQGQTALDYDTVSIGSHYLQPSIVVEKPSIHFATTAGSFDLSTDRLEFVGSFTSLGRFTAKFPETVTLKTDNESVTLRVTSAPELSLRTTADTSKKQADTIILDEFKLEDETPLKLAVNAMIAGKQREVELRYPTTGFAKRWMRIRYEIYPYLHYFSGQVQGKIQGGNGTKLP